MTEEKTASHRTLCDAAFFVPVRGAGCIRAVDEQEFDEIVAVPVRGAGCIDESLQGVRQGPVTVPVRGTGCILQALLKKLKVHTLLSP